MSFLDSVFGKTGEVENLYKSPEVAKALANQASNRLPAYQQRFDTGLASLGAGADKAYGNLIGMQPDASNVLSSVTNRVAGFDPIAAESQRRAEMLTQLQGLAPMLAGAGRGQQNLAMARLGYAGVPTSSYQSLLDSSRSAAALAPIASNIMSGSAADMARLGNLLYSQPGAVNEGILAREGVYTRPLNVLGIPLSAAQGALNSETASLGGLSQAGAANFGGFNQDYQKGFLDYMNQGTGAISKSVGDIAGAYGNVKSGGMLGSLGGMFGGGKGGGGGGGGQGGGYVLGGGGAPPSYYDQYGS